MKKIIGLSALLIFTQISVCDSDAKVGKAHSKKQAESPKKKRDRYEIDRIIAVVPSAEGNRVITQSEKDRPAIDGTVRTEKDLIRGARLYLEAKRYGMLPSDEDIDSHLNMIKRDNKMTHDDVVKLFDSAGYTFAEGREQLGEMSAINTLLSVKVHSRLLIPEREVRAFYDANPQYLEPQYELQRGLLAFAADGNKEQQRKKIEATLRAHKSIPGIEWTAPFWIDLVDLAEDKQFITEMKPGEVRLAQELFDSFEFFKLVNLRERRLKSFEERYSEIVDVLRRPRYERMFSEFEQQLEATMPVIYMHETQNI